MSIDRRELFLSSALMLAMFVAFVHLLLARPGRGPRLRPHDGWLVAAGVFVLLYFAVPDVVAAGAHVSDRFAWFALVSAAAWIGAGSAPRASHRRIAVAFAVIAIAALGVRFQKQRELSDLVAEFVSAKAVIEEGRVLLPLALSPHGPRDDAGLRLGYRVKPFLHATGWIVAERGGVDLKNSQANTDQCPVRFPAERNPFTTIAGSLGRMEGTPPCVDLGAAARAPTDYVLVWGATREELRTPCGGALEAELAAGYEPVFLSAATRAHRGLASADEDGRADALRTPRNEEAPGSRRGPRVRRCARDRYFFFFAGVVAFAGAAPSAAGAARPSAPSRRTSGRGRGCRSRPST